MSEEDEAKVDVYTADGHSTTVYLDKRTGIGVPKHWDGKIWARWDEPSRRWVQVKAEVYG